MQKPVLSLSPLFAQLGGGVSCRDSATLNLNMVSRPGGPLRVGLAGLSTVACGGKPFQLLFSVVACTNSRWLSRAESRGRISAASARPAKPPGGAGPPSAASPLPARAPAGGPRRVNERCLGTGILNLCDTSAASAASGSARLPAAPGACGPPVGTGASPAR